MVSMPEIELRHPNRVLIYPITMYEMDGRFKVWFHKESHGIIIETNDPDNYPIHEHCTMWDMDKFNEIKEIS